MFLICGPDAITVTWLREYLIHPMRGIQQMPISHHPIIQELFWSRRADSTYPRTLWMSTVSKQGSVSFVPRRYVPPRSSSPAHPPFRRTHPQALAARASRLPTRPAALDGPVPQSFWAEERSCPFPLHPLFSHSESSLSPGPVPDSSDIQRAWCVLNCGGGVGE